MTPRFLSGAEAQGLGKAHGQGKGLGGVSYLPHHQDDEEDEDEDDEEDEGEGEAVSYTGYAISSL